MSFRIGSGLDRTFATAPLLPGRNVYSFAEIDGNTFEGSHAVRLKHWQGQAVIGFSLNYRQWAMSFSTVWATERHRFQSTPGNYGTLNIGYRF